MKAKPFDPPPNERLERALGYKFTDPSLLETALTHRSHSANNYERLEFLGDSVLNCGVAMRMFVRFERATEGDLSRLRASLVKRETVAAVAREIKLGPHIKLGAAELKSGAFDRDSVLCDAFEAVLAAVLLDGGIETVTDIIGRLFDERIETLSQQGVQKDAKSRLQEHMQALGKPLPEYRLISKRGVPPHETFKVECDVAELAGPVRGDGRTRRIAEQNAASQALAALGSGK